MTTLKRVLTLRDLVLFNLVAVIGLRWLATSSKAGPAALVLWALAALLFFIPQGLTVVELSRRFPEEGGIYAWTKRAFGEGHGFVCGWCYWICNVLYYPNLLISTAVIATFAFGKGDSGLEESWPYVLAVTLGSLWLAVAVNIVGLAKGRWLQNAGGIGPLFHGCRADRIRHLGRRHRCPERESAQRARVPSRSHGFELSQSLGVDRVRVRGARAIRRHG